MNPVIPVILDHLFPNPEIPLRHTNAFSFLVAVVLSAQCTDLKVNQVTPVLFEKGDQPEDLIRLGLEKIEEILRPLGLYKTKAKNIFKLSQILIDTYNSIVPDDLEELKASGGWA